jgi:hypothetical protein
MTFKTVEITHSASPFELPKIPWGDSGPGYC